MKRTLLLLVLLSTLISACGTTSRAEREMVEAMDLWAAHVRWGEQDGLVDFIHPDYLAENPIREVDIARLGLFSVSRYRVRQHLEVPGEKGVDRLVEISMYHHGTAQERVVQYREVWRYDEDLKRWFLHSGLPDPSRH